MITKRRRTTTTRATTQASKALKIPPPPLFPRVPRLALKVTVAAALINASNFARAGR